MARSLAKRRKNICTTGELLNDERKHIVNALVSNGYPRKYVTNIFNEKNLSLNIRSI